MNSNVVVARCTNGDAYGKVVFLRPRSHGTEAPFAISRSHSSRNGLAAHGHSVAFVFVIERRVASSLLEFHSFFFSFLCASLCVLLILLRGTSSLHVESRREFSA